MLKPAVNSSQLSFIARRKQEVSSLSPIDKERFLRAGVGRTGTFIAIDAMIERIEREGTVNVYDFITQMRCERHLMVQTVVGLSTEMICSILDVSLIYLQLETIRLYPSLPVGLLSLR